MNSWLRTLLLIMSIGHIMCKVSGQFYSMPTGESLWVASWCIGPSGPCSGDIYWYDALETDTMINGIEYTWMHGGGAIRDDLAGRVYIVPSGEQNERLLYDFSAQPGDTLFGLYSVIWDNHDQIVVTVDTVTFNGTERRRMGVMHIDWGGSQASNYWIQGIGSLTGPIQTCMCPSVSGMTALACMSENGVAQYGGAIGEPYDCLIHLNAEELTAEKPVMTFHPNPSTGVFSLNGISVPVEVLVFDATGREVTRTTERTLDVSGQPPGLYTAVLSTERGSQALRLVLVAP